MMNVLIFDDNVNVEMELTALMNESNYNVSSFNSSEEVLTWLDNKENTVDLALLDIVENPILFEEVKEKEEEDREAGFKIANRLKKINRDIPIVFFSAYGDDPAIKQMAKTYSPYELYEKGVDDSDGIGDGAKDKILKRVGMVLNEKRKILHFRDYFSQTKYGKIIVEGKCYQKISSNQEDLFPEIEKFDVEFLIKIDAIIKAEKVFKDSDGNQVYQKQERKKKIDSQGKEKMVVVTYYERQQKKEILRSEKANEYLKLMLEHKYHEVYIPSIKPLDFYRQIDVLFEIHEKPNPFVVIRNGVYLNVNFIEDLNFTPSDEIIEFKYVKGIIDNNLEYVIGTDRPSESGVKSLRSYFRKFKTYKPQKNK